MSNLKVIHNKENPLAKHNSPAIRVSGGDLLFCSGKVGTAQPNGTRDIKKATVFALNRLRDVLELGGSSWKDVIKYNIFLMDMNDFESMNEAFCATLPDPKPARTCVQAAKLPGGGIIEIECVASVPAAKL